MKNHRNQPPITSPIGINRRQMLARSSTGFGMIALADLLAREGAAADPLDGTKPATPALKPRAKHVIFLYMSGGVSQVDSFDPKPYLQKNAGKPMPVPVLPTQFNSNGNILPNLWPFKKRGESGIEISDLFPKIAEHADDLTVIRSMTAPFSEHAQGNFFIHTGIPFLGHPSAGAWVTYGLGRANENLPAFVVLHSGESTEPHGGVGLFSNGFLPASTQASFLRVDAKEPVANIRPREPLARQRRRLDYLRQLDSSYQQTTGDENIESAIANYETAFRMQTAVPDLVDLSQETEATKKMYGLDAKDKLQAAYAQQCLMARRLVERGVRFIELSTLAYNIGGGNGGNPWDHHGHVKEGHQKQAMQVDQPIAALLKDLKQRGLLDDTLVVFTGEFGRTPFSQGGFGSELGRDHNPFGFSLWMAGGGMKPGTVYGATDEHGYHAVENKCSVYDLWATVLHQMGLDHYALIYRHGGRDFRLTDVHGNVLHDLLG